jgi:hypothetical protein
MWKGEWKAYVFWCLGVLLVGLLFAAVAVCIIGSRQHAEDTRPPAQHETR